jgi:phospholipid N-methyltransferase
LPSEPGGAARPHDTGTLLRFRRTRSWRAARARARATARRTRSAGAFVVRALAQPSLVGAVVPSSRRLANAMAAATDGAQWLIELGAGTGVVTDALRRRHPAVPLVAVEIDAQWAQRLQQRHPRVDVRCAPAHEVVEALKSLGGDVVVVSSLPFRSLPPTWHEVTRRAIERFLRADPRRRLVQYTYQPRAPFAVDASSGLVWRRRGVVWGNLPPAWIWQLGAAAPR